MARCVVGTVVAYLLVSLRGKELDTVQGTLGLLTAILATAAGTRVGLDALTRQVAQPAYKEEEEDKKKRMSRRRRASLRDV